MPHNSNFRGLDYNSITQEPARGVVVQAVNASGTVLATDVTDGSGNYDVNVDPNTDVRIRVRSQLQRASGATWDIQVLDNTFEDPSGNPAPAIYVLNGSLTNSGASNSTRDLNAASGWGGTSYTGTRAAAPFSILDAIYETVNDIALVDPDVNFPFLQVFWSVDNRPSPGDPFEGNIGTSSYTRTEGVPTIRILGDADNDTDEYDIHVVVHEFGHYFEDQLSRSDSPGGSHSLNNRLDSRLSFGEGWGNAFSGMILDDPVYRDSLGAQQASGFAFSVEDDLTAVGSSREPGWYNEASVQQVLYDIYDSVSDGSDTISAGLGPIYAAFTDPTYVNNADFTSIFAFANRLRDEAAINGGDLDAMLAAEGINGTGPRGVGETNDGGLSAIFPTVYTASSPYDVYTEITVGGPAVTVCSTASNGETNKHGVREFLSLTVNSAATLTLTASEVSGPTGATDPDFVVWRNGTRIFGAFEFLDGTETLTQNFSPGRYAIEFLDANNDNDDIVSANSCFSFTVT